MSKSAPPKSKCLIGLNVTQDGKARTIRVVNRNTIVNTLNRKPKRVGGRLSDYSRDVMLHIIELRC